AAVRSASDFLAVACGKSGQRVLPADLQLAADVGAMRIDGFSSDAQLLGNLLAAFLLRDSPQNRPFVRREQAQARRLFHEPLDALRLLDEIRRHRRARIVLAR